MEDRPYLNSPLGIYVNPSNYDAVLLSQYWLPTEQGGKEVAKIETSVNRLLDKGLPPSNSPKIEAWDGEGRLEAWRSPVNVVPRTLSSLPLSGVFREGQS